MHVEYVCVYVCIWVCMYVCLLWCACKGNDFLEFIDYPPYNVQYPCRSISPAFSVAWSGLHQVLEERQSCHPFLYHQCTRIHWEEALSPLRMMMTIPSSTPPRPTSSPLLNTEKTPTFVFIFITSNSTKRMFNMYTKKEEGFMDASSFMPPSPTAKRPPSNHDPPQQQMLWSVYVQTI